MKNKAHRRVLLLLAALLACCVTADAQLFKKLKKKKKKQPVEAVAEVQPAVNTDSLQMAMADIRTCADNHFNRNAFLGIPMGISAKGFHTRLVAQGFSEPAHQQNYFYLYQGKAFGADARLYLLKSDSTAMVYGVSVEETAAGLTEQSARQRFQELKEQLSKVYGDGYVCSRGEEYVITTPLGAVSLHYERVAGGGGYSIGYQIDDAKAYSDAYREMADPAGEELPRDIDAGGLADTPCHSAIAELAQLLMLAGSPQKAKPLLATYDYKVGRETAAQLPATFSMGNGYQARATITKRGKAITAVAITANDRAELVRDDLLRLGFTEEGTTFVSGSLKATLTQNKQEQQVLSMSRNVPAKKGGRKRGK